MSERFFNKRSGATTVLLLFFLLTLAGCGSQAADTQQGAPEKARMSEITGKESTASQPAKAEDKDRKEKAPAEDSGTKDAGSKVSKDSGEQANAESGKTVEAVLPEDVLSKEDLEKEAPEREDWNAPSGATVSTTSKGTSAGTIPAVKPFNFGRDPGGPEDKTLYVGIPKLGLDSIPVYNTTSEDGLRKSTVHVPATGFPWQEGANVYIAGHRLGYPNTGSFRVFYQLDELAAGDEITLTDAAGGEYVYRVTRNVVVGPENVEVMNPVEGESVITLQTCTLPDYKKRIVVQGELVEKSA